MRWPSNVVAACVAVLTCACGTGDTRIDPGDLELRDLLGVSPEAAGHWDEAQRAAAQRVLLDALDRGSQRVEVELSQGAGIDDQVERSLGVLDARRYAGGDEALGFVRVELTTTELSGATRIAPTVIATASGNAGRVVKLDLSQRWGDVPTRSREVLSALAVDAGHTGDHLVVVPAPRLPVIASYVATMPPHLVVNPVLLAALDPKAETLMQPPLATTSGTTTVARSTELSPTSVHPIEPKAVAGNPYSFYGSVAECAYAQRNRCDSCVAANNCVPVTSTSDGNAECQTLAENDGRGYYLLCINLALAITSVEDCTNTSVASCPQDTNAANDLSKLESNAAYLDDSTCGAGLDKCLTKIYGAPQGTFPGIVDGGVDPPPDPPRQTDLSCGDSCSNNNANCDFSPNCSCTGPSCGNSLSCDSSCSDSNTQNGCGDNCESCSTDSSGNSSGGSCGGSSGGSSGGDSCGSCGGSSSGGSSGGDSCGSCGGSSGGSSGGGSCGSCSSGGSSSSSSGGGCSGGGGGGGCQVVKKQPSAFFAVALSLTWALLPLPVAAVVRRRSRKGKKKRRDSKANDASTEVAS